MKEIRLQSYIPYYICVIVFLPTIIGLVMMMFFPNNLNTKHLLWYTISIIVHSFGAFFYITFKIVIGSFNKTEEKYKSVKMTRYSDTIIDIKVPHEEKFRKIKTEAEYFYERYRLL